MGAVAALRFRRLVLRGHLLHVGACGACFATFGSLLKVRITPLVRNGALPLPLGTSLSWIPPSSLYCCHRSVSRISMAARNLRMATSPRLRLLLPAAAKAGNPLVNSSVPLTPAPAPMTPAPATTSPLRKKERRLV